MKITTAQKSFFVDLYVYLYLYIMTLYVGS